MIKRYEIVYLTVDKVQITLFTLSDWLRVASHEIGRPVKMWAIRKNSEATDRNRNNRRQAQGEDVE